MSAVTGPAETRSFVYSGVAASNRSHRLVTRHRKMKLVIKGCKKGGKLANTARNTRERERERVKREVLTSEHVVLVTSYAACSILRVLTQWGATLVIIK